MQKRLLTQAPPATDRAQRRATLQEPWTRSGVSGERRKLQPQEMAALARDAATSGKQFLAPMRVQNLEVEAFPEPRGRARHSVRAAQTLRIERVSGLAARTGAHGVTRPTHPPSAHFATRP